MPEQATQQGSSLRDLATVIRSKNAGPFEICIDLLFPDDAAYEAARESPVLTPEGFSRLYGLPVEKCDVVWFPAARALKCTMPRRIVAGDPDDFDVYGAQYYRRMLDLTI